LLAKAKEQGVFSNTDCRPDERIKEILERWYIREPILMMACLSHELIPTLKVMSTRTGKGVIEYNPQSL
jgi:hypothetical protein